MLVCANKDMFVFVIGYFNYVKDKITIVYAIEKVRRVCCHFSQYAVKVSEVEIHYFIVKLNFKTDFPLASLTKCRHLYIDIVTLKSNTHNSSSNIKAYI